MTFTGVESKKKQNFRRVSNPDGIEVCSGHFYMSAK